MKKNVMEASELPVDRKQLFFGAFRKDYSTLLLCSLFQSIFALPLYALFLLALIEGSAAATSDDPVVSAFVVRRWFYIFSLPCLLVFSVGASGVSEVMKKLVWNQSSTFFKDFGKGIKSSALSFLAVTALYGLFVSSAVYVADVMILANDSAMIKAVIIASAFLLVFLATGILMFEYSALTVYQTKLFAAVKNSFVLCLGTLPKTACILVLVMLPFLLAALTLSSVWLSVVLMTALALMGFGYMFLIGTLYTHYVFDKHVNEKNYPTIYRRGLYCTKPDSEKH